MSRVVRERHHEGEVVTGLDRFIREKPSRGLPRCRCPRPLHAALVEREHPPAEVGQRPFEGDPHRQPQRPDDVNMTGAVLIPMREAVVAVVQVCEVNRYVGRHGHIAPVDNGYRQYEGALAGQQILLSDLTPNVVAGLGASSVAHLSTNHGLADE